MEVTADLAVLPYPDTSFNIVSARSLHKDIQAGLGKPETPNEKWKCMRDCLAECNRILIPGGRLEYIYFEDEITNGGPLTTEMQPFLQEVWGPGFDDDTVRMPWPDTLSWPPSLFLSCFLSFLLSFFLLFPLYFLVSLSLSPSASITAANTAPRPIAASVLVPAMFLASRLRSSAIC